MTGSAIPSLYENASVRQENFNRHEKRFGIVNALLARIIHEHFCCNRGFAATTSLREKKNRDIHRSEEDRLRFPRNRVNISEGR
jgi:hypothetical protein